MTSLFFAVKSAETFATFQRNLLRLLRKSSQTRGRAFSPGTSLDKENLMYTLMTRLKEPSTYAGLAAAALALGISTEQFGIWAAGVAGVFAFISIIVKDPGSDS